tara:strand:+ start:114 stop:464 length:351 start_codon:yes stop_codon:yes gene_type:complete
MKIIIGQKKMLQEQSNRGDTHIFQITCDIKLKKDADRELLKTDIRATTGITTVTTVPGTEKTTDLFVYQSLKIKFQPYDLSPSEFVRNLSQRFRKLNKRGLASFRFGQKTLTKVKV